MKKTLICLPDSKNSDYIGQLLAFGQFLENKSRPGCEFDLQNWPNPLWQLIAARMNEGFTRFLAARPVAGEVLMLQWYNSGIFIKTASQTIAFDVVALPRYYSWPDTEGLTDKIAAALDALFITHNHQDHFDIELVAACLKSGRDVFMHPGAAPNDLPVTPMPDGVTVLTGEISVRARHCCHVWRKNPGDVPLTAFEAVCDGKFRFLFCGDADYTGGFADIAPDVNVLFITWRNPGPAYEDGHPEQIGVTADAVKIVLNELRPTRVILQHYGELDHIYRGFSASYEMAALLIRDLPVHTSIHFWGDLISLTGE